MTKENNNDIAISSTAATVGAVAGAGVGGVGYVALIASGVILSAPVAAIGLPVAGAIALGTGAFFGFKKTLEARKTHTDDTMGKSANTLLDNDEHLNAM